MKITIDTKEDSHHDIKKLIGLLNHLVSDSDEPSYSNQPKNIFEDGSAFGETSSEQPASPTPPVSPNSMFNMFNTDDTSTKEGSDDGEQEEKSSKPISIDIVEY